MIDHNAPTTALLAWGSEDTTQPIRPYTRDRWPTVIAAIATAIGALLIAAGPILDTNPAEPPAETCPATPEPGTTIDPVCSFAYPIVQTTSDRMALFPDFTPRPGNTIRPTNLAELLGCPCHR